MILKIFLQQFAKSNPRIMLVPGIINSVQMVVMEDLYFRIGIALANYENPRTDTQFQNSLILKVYAFFFFNAFSPLYYISFLRAPMEGKCADLPSGDPGTCIAVDPRCDFLHVVGVR